MAGSGDRAEDKERWFMDAFGVDALFGPERPVVSAKGAVVTNIAHIPAALTAVMKLNGVAPDFRTHGSLALKPWLANDQGLVLPPAIAMPTVEALAPYNLQIAALGQQVGAVIPRQNMKDKSGATVMDPRTQVTSVHGHSVLDLAVQPLEANFALPLVHKVQSKESGASEPRALPGVHHPIFKGKPVNYDPRERFIADFMAKRGDYNVFHAFYRELVQALYDAGASRYVFCVNVDAVIAALLLAILWKDFKSGALAEKDLETAAFNVFLYGRMIGAAAEIDDHLNRGRNMDTRTPQEQCAFVI